ncbi:hypothetical protein [Crateriforma spongiae]|uniref:hypothetical protein n=1 Tax=Crateriforma spongiae TaxID=2724528 RepID=UPI001447D70C|nr:hypothetical protein [Crateriforma spongiae]
MTCLWQSLEDDGGLSDVLGGWRRRFGTEFESLRRFLCVTDKISSSYRISATADPWRVIEDAGEYVALNDETYEHRSLTRSDVALHRFDVRRLALEIAEALKLVEGYEQIGPSQHLSRIGNLPSEFESRAVWLCIRKTEHEIMDGLSDIATHDGGRIVVLHPTGRRLTPRVRRLMDRFGNPVVTLSDLVQLHRSHRIVAKNDWRQVLSTTMGIHVGGPVPEYSFQNDDDIWMVAFGTQPRPVRDNSGMPHIAHLLARPNESIAATTLEALASGIDEVAKAGSRGEQTDRRTLKEANDRLHAIAAELESANANGEMASVTELQTERDEILTYVRKATGLAGKIRDDSDAARSGDSVSRAIRRAIKLIDKKCPELAGHLRQHLETGVTLRYRPSQPIDWKF